MAPTIPEAQLHSWDGDGRYKKNTLNRHSIRELQLISTPEDKELPPSEEGAPQKYVAIDSSTEQIGPRLRV